jgi:hypothetical protein
VFVYTDVAAGGSTGRRLPEPDDRGRHAISRAPHGQNRTVDRALSPVIEEEAPDAWLLNETNPMAMVVMALSRATSVRRVGLCHDAENTASELAEYLVPVVPPSRRKRRRARDPGTGVPGHTRPSGRTVCRKPAVISGCWPSGGEVDPPKRGVRSEDRGRPGVKYPVHVHG